MRTFYYMVECEPSTSGVQCVRSEKAEGCPIPCCYLNNRPVYFGNVAHQGDADESYFLDACYADTLEDLNEDELETLTEEHREYLAEQWFEHQVCRAEAMYEGDR